MTTSRPLFVLLALMALAVPLFADSPEYLVGDTVTLSAPGSRHYSAAATDGTDFFVVWTDRRTPGRGAVMATRVTRGGEVLDRYGIRIASVPAHTSWPAVMWDGEAYLVVWTQGFYFGESLQRDEVWTTRVARDGQVLAAPRLISEAGTQATTSSGVYAASNGRLTVVAYRHAHFTGAVEIAVLDREANVIRRQVVTNLSVDLSRGISVAATATNFVVTWATNDLKIAAVALNSDGRVISRSMQIGNGEDPAVATDGSSFTIVWRQWKPDLAEWVLMSRTTDGELAQLGTPQELGGDQVVEWPSLLWRGDRYEVIAGQQSYTQTRINPYGLLSVEFDRDGVQRISSRYGDALFNSVVPQPVAVTNGSDVLVVYKHPNSSSTQIVARLYRGSSLAPDVQQVLSWSGNAHESPAIASGGAGHFAAWTENHAIYTTRIDAHGNSLDGRGVELTKSGFVVRAAFDGTNYVVAWLDDRFIGVRYISPATGATVAQVYVPARAWEPDRLALAVSPDAAYVAWVDEDDHRVRATRVIRESGMADLPVVVSPEGMIAGYPAMAWNGSMLLVAWNELRVWSGNVPPTPALNVLAARVSSGLSLLDPAPLLVATAGASVVSEPSVASNGVDWLVVSDLDERQLVARRVLRSGQVEGTAASTIGEGAAPAVTWDGTRYAVAYKAGGSLVQPEYPLLLGALPATGALPAMRRTLVATDVVSPPSIVRTAAGDVAIVYTKVSFRPEHMGVERSYFRVMDFSQRRRAVRR